MKKFIGIVLLLLFSVFVSGQSETSKDVAKKDTVTLKILTESKKQAAANENLLSLLTQAVNNQSAACKGIVAVANSFNDNIAQLTEEVEERNKNDGQLITDKLYYTQERVRYVMKIERWLNFITITLSIVFLGWQFYPNAPFERYSHTTSVSKFIWGVGMTAVFYFLMLKFLTLLFNGDYYVIKELIKLYT